MEKAIKVVEENKAWNARVVYGDTDSLFVEVVGATREQAFKVGREIAAKVTSLNPAPMKLQFDKVCNFYSNNNCLGVPSLLLGKQKALCWIHV